MGGSSGFLSACSPFVWFRCAQSLLIGVGTQSRRHSPSLFKGYLLFTIHLKLPPTSTEESWVVALPCLLGHLLQRLPVRWNLWLSGEAGLQFPLHRFGPWGVLPKCANWTSIKGVCRAQRTDEHEGSESYPDKPLAEGIAQAQSRPLEGLHGNQHWKARGSWE